MSYTTCLLLNNPPVPLSHLLVCDYHWDFPFIHPESCSFFTCPWFLPATTICSPFAATYSKKKKKKPWVTHLPLPSFFLSLLLNVSFKLPVKYETSHEVVWIKRRPGTSRFEVLIWLGQTKQFSGFLLLFLLFCMSVS